MFLSSGRVSRSRGGYAMIERLLRKSDYNFLCVCLCCVSQIKAQSTQWSQRRHLGATTGPQTSVWEIIFYMAAKIQGTLATASSVYGLIHAFTKWFLSHDGISGSLKSRGYSDLWDITPVFKELTVEKTDVDRSQRFALHALREGGRVCDPLPGSPQRAWWGSPEGFRDQAVTLELDRKRCTHFTRWEGERGIF